MGFVPQYSDYISIVKLPGDNTPYYVKDSEARDWIQQIASLGIKFTIAWKGNTVPDVTKIPLGVEVEYNQQTYTGTLVASADTASSIVLVYSKTVEPRDVYDEYITVTEGAEGSETYFWEKLGDTNLDVDNLGNFAYADTGSGSQTLNDYVTSGSFSNGSASVSASYTPAGSVSVTLSQTSTAGTLTTSDYTPEGTVSTPTITVTPSTTTAKVLDSDGSVTAGTAASYTRGSFSGGSFTQGSDAHTPASWSASVANEVLQFSWTADTFTQGTDSFTPASHAADTFVPNSPTSVTLPTFKNQTVATGIASATSTQPTFTGTTAEDALVTGVSYDKAGVQSSTFSGTAATIDSTGTASGTVTLTKGNKTISITVTPDA